MPELMNMYMGCPLVISHEHWRPFDMAEVKTDWLDTVNKLPEEVAYFRLELLAGRINGSVYSGSCACLKGTLAKSATEQNFPDGIGDIQVEEILKGFGILCNYQSPIEQFFLHIHQGDTPATNPYAAVILEWCDEFLLERAKVQAPELVEVR